MRSVSAFATEYRPLQVTRRMSRAQVTHAFCKKVKPPTKPTAPLLLNEWRIMAPREVARASCSCSHTGKPTALASRSRLPDCFLQNGEANVFQDAHNSPSLPPLTEASKPFVVLNCGYSLAGGMYGTVHCLNVNLLRVANLGFSSRALAPNCDRRDANSTQDDPIRKAVCR